jgi:dynein heavy chain
MNLFDLYVNDTLRFVRRNCKELGPTTDISLFRSLLNLLESLNDDLKTNEFASYEVLVRLEYRFMFSLVWSLGGMLDTDGRAKFNVYFRDAMKNKFSKSNFPPDGSVYDFVYLVDFVNQNPNCQFKASHEWFLWTDTIELKPFIDPAAKFDEITIPTKDTSRYNFLMETLISHGHPFIFVGPTGTGKSKYITNKLLSMNEGYVPMFVNFSARTSANQTQDIIFSKLDKRRKGVYGPPLGKKFLIFVDDLNMPAKEVYGAQPPIELLRQWLDHGNWYDRKDTSRLEIIDILFLGAMGPPGGGRAFITPRFLRHFNQISINQFDDETMLRIFSLITTWHTNRLDFSEKIRDVADTLVSSTIAIHKAALANLLPTPAKSHYTFNLRDFARVIQGLTLSHPSAYNDDYSMTRLWVHEVYRVYYDRLVTDDDRSWFFGKMKSILSEVNEKDIDKVFRRIATRKDGHVQESDMRAMMFGSFASSLNNSSVSASTAMDENGSPPTEQASSTPPATSAKLYVEFNDINQVSEFVNRELQKYNSFSKTKMDLVLFRFAVEHICRICRIMQLPGGHALLLGVGGSGRQSLTRISAFMMDFEVFQIEISKSYGQIEWREDIKKVTKKAGNENKDIVFLFTDSQIKDESFVEDISNLLNAGEVPNLFAADEKQDIITRCTKSLQEEGKLKAEMSSATIYNYFISRVKRNLHIVLCFSPIGENFRRRMRQFNSLVNCCTIDYFQAWPDDALEAVADKNLRDITFEDESTRTAIIAICKQFHQSAAVLSNRFLSTLGRYNYITPTSYLELLLQYKSLLGLKREEVSAVKRRYAAGLEKLDFAAAQVARMQRELGDLQPQLKKTSEETSEMLVKIEKESKEVDAARQVIQADEAAATKKADEAGAIKSECENDLAQALPLMNSALAALDTLKKQDIDLVKSMKNPPDGVKLVMEAVCVMKDLKPERIPDPSGSGKMIFDYWKTSMKMLGDPKFLESLKTYDKDTIPPAVIKQIRARYISNPEFRPEKVKNASSAAEGLCNWVVAIEAYDRVVKIVEPKQKVYQSNHFFH